MEVLGEVLGVQEFKDVRKITQDFLDTATAGKDFYELKLPFDGFVAFYITMVLIQMCGTDTVTSWDNVVVRPEFLNIYNKIKCIIDLFTDKFGLPRVDMNKLVFSYTKTKDSNEEF